MLSRATELGDDELPVLGHAEAPDNWFLLTTERLLSRRGGEVCALAISDISDAIIDLAALQASGRTKLEWRELKLMTMGGNQHTIFVEPGAPLNGVWSVLKNVGARNRGNAV
jgi:hypothetical protein